MFKILPRRHQRDKEAQRFANKLKKVVKQIVASAFGLLTVLAYLWQIHKTKIP